MGNIKLTITISNWNRDWFLDRSIYLISKQTFHLSHLSQDDWELIIVDDGSTDETDKVINRYKSMNIIKNFHYVKKIKKREKYGNCAIARNIGARFGTGDYILFTDPEVMPLPDWAEHHYIAHGENIVKIPGTNNYTTVDIKSCDVMKMSMKTDRNVIGYCLQPRLYHVVDNSEKCRGPFLGNAYTDYDWFDIVETWKIMVDKINRVQKEFNLTDKQIRDEFYIYQATQAGHSVSRKLFFEIGGYEEDYANVELGLDKWAGEDTWFRHCLARFGSLTLELEKAKAIHIYHDKVCSNCDAVSYANKYATDYPDKYHANLNKNWGLIEENGFKIMF